MSAGELDCREERERVKRVIVVVVDRRQDFPRCADVTSKGQRPDFIEPQISSCGGKTQTHRHREERGQEQGFPQRKRR